MTRFDPQHLEPEVLQFLLERHLATLTTLRLDGSPHVVPVGFTFDAATCTARVITSGDSAKARNAGRADAVGALCQVDRARWLTLHGRVRIDRDPAVVRDAEQRYARRYRPPRENPARVVVVMEVATVLGSVRPPTLTR